MEKKINIPSDLTAKFEASDPEIQKFIIALDTENLKSQNIIAKLRAENVSLKNRIAVLEKENFQYRQHIEPSTSEASEGLNRLLEKIPKSKDE